MFFIGLYNSGMVILLILILKFLSFELIFPTNYKIYLLFLIIFFVFFIQHFIIMRIIYIYTPHHVSFANTVLFIFAFISYRILDNFSIVILMCEIIISFLMIFSALIFSEMVIINKWGLNEKTKDGLLTKAKQEYNENDNDNRKIELVFHFLKYSTN